MEYPKNDSSETDDDIRNRGIIRASEGLACSGVMVINSGPVPYEKDLRDMEFQIHCIEMEAYGAVLRAFIAQSDVLSWGKEGLITELRKELRVSDVEHREILGKINSDDSIKSIRELRKNAEAQLTTMNPPPFGPNSMGHVPRKKLKHGRMTVSSSPKYLVYAQPSPTAVPPPTNMQPSTVKARGSLIVRSSKKGFVRSGAKNLKPGSDIIEIRSTDKLIYEIERVCGGENPDPAQVQRAKLILKDHERALLEAIGKLADVSDGGNTVTSTVYMLLMFIVFEFTCLSFVIQMTHLIEVSTHTLVKSHRGEHMFSRILFTKSDNRLRSYYNEGYGKHYVEKAGIPCVLLQD